MGPGSAAHHAASHSASKTRVNALMALRSIRARDCANGYRFAKWQGKPNFALP